MDGALEYLDQQIDALKQHVPAALGAFDETGVHQARVATRRLKAGLDLLSPLIDPKQVTAMARAGKRLRRRLGPLRDLDVMISHLAAYPTSPRTRAAVEWVAAQFDQQRIAARVGDRDEGKKHEKLADKFNDWWPLRRLLQAHHDAIEPLLTNALHDRFAAFAEEADWVSGIADVPADKKPIDVHQVRINGKALRYTFEIAAAQGLKIPKRVFKNFKAMQESLGAWHDYVVLAERSLAAMSDTLLAHHEPELALNVLDLAKALLRKSVVELNRFRTQWKRGGAALRAAMDKHLPLSKDVTAEMVDVVGAVSPSVTQLQTGPDLLATTQTPSPAIADEAEAPAS